MKALILVSLVLTGCRGVAKSPSIPEFCHALLQCKVEGIDQLVFRSVDGKETDEGFELCVTSGFRSDFSTSISHECKTVEKTSLSCEVNYRQHFTDNQEVCQIPDLK